MTQPTPAERHTVDTITSDALDALYEQLEAAQQTELARQLATCDKAFASATLRAARAEAAVATFAAIFEGFGRLLATSSRDWGSYRVDAWLYAVVLGWDCEETEHGDTCIHGVLEEMAQAHGWSPEAVAKARRYRATVRAALDEHQEQPRT